LFAVLVLASCSKKDDDKDPIIGEWMQVSETDNSIALVLTSCDLSEKVEFLADGSTVIEDKDEVSGSCVLNPLPTGFVTKWAKISTNQFKLIIKYNGTLAFEQ